MSKENYDALKEAIDALPQNEVKTPNMPVGEAVQEAENLYAWCQDDLQALTKAGLDKALVDDLPLRAGACRYAQSLWSREFQTQEEAQKEWSDRSDEAFDLRDELLHHFTFAFRNQPDLVNKVQTIREGGSNADMLQDLSDLHVLGLKHKEPLKAIGFDMSLLNTAAQTADELSVVLAKANGESGDDSEMKVQRDRAYTYMKKAMDEIRRTGQYVFWRNEDRVKGYVSQYHKRKRRSSVSDTDNVNI